MSRPPTTTEFLFWRFSAVVLLLLGLARPALAESDALLTVARQELDRAVELLSTQPDPPYWISLGLVDRRVLAVQATHGSAGHVEETHHRMGDVDLRVGSQELDNTHKIRDASISFDDVRADVDLPVEDEPAWATRMAIWRAVDDSYRAARRRLIKVQANDAVKVAREDQSADFSDAPVVQDIQPLQSFELDGEAWQDRVRRLSGRYLDHPQVYDSNVSFRAVNDVHYLLTSEGTTVRHSRQRIRISTWARTIADDGMVLAVHDYVDVASADGLPGEETLEAMVDQVAIKVTALRSAPMVEPYVGPAILRGRAAAVFFHEILGHRVEGHRQNDEDEGQTLADKVGQSIFPSFISVVDDPTLPRWGTTDLNGSYAYDDEGVAAERVQVVEDGVLEGFLMSRSPIEGLDRSNGHGRRQPGSAVVARQGNLIVDAEGGVPFSDLRDQLVRMVKDQGKPFGLIFDDISGGFTFTGRTSPNSFSVRPVTVWRVYPDGRPDELVRGVDLIGTPLTTFARIVGASDEVQVFNGVCGAESGWVPVSAVAPDLLVDEVEVQRREKDNDRPPLRLPPPVDLEVGIAVSDDAILTAAETELALAVETLRLPDQPDPYLVSYEMLEGEVATASAAFGALRSSSIWPHRNLRVEVRVGDYEKDNTHFSSFASRDGVVSRGLPLDDVEVAFRREIWLATDQAYKGATEQFSAKSAARDGRGGSFGPDLSRMSPLQQEAGARAPVEEVRVADRVVALSRVWRETPGVEEGSAIARDWQGQRLLLNTEGTQAWMPTGFAVVRVEGVVRAEDGARLRTVRSWVGRTWEDLPGEAEMVAEVQEAAAWIGALRTAPIEENYLGPVLFEAPAARELFRQLLLPELSGTPPPEEPPDPYGEAQAPIPTARVGRRLLPQGWDVVDDPVSAIGEPGGYLHDFDGVPAQRVVLVRDGVLRDVLMSRIPREDRQQSNGHGRGLGTEPREAIPASVRIEPKRSVGWRRLRAKALALARQAGLPYVLVIRRIEEPAVAEDFHVAFSGEGPLPGLTRPVEAMRLYADGREEPVRGLGFVGVDRRVLRDIAVAGAVTPLVGVMDTSPGAERFGIGAVGGLPASWSVPAVVVTEMELRGGSGREPRLLPAPAPGPVASGDTAQP